METAFIHVITKSNKVTLFKLPFVTYIQVGISSFVPLIFFFQVPCLFGLLSVRSYVFYPNANQHITVVEFLTEVCWSVMYKMPKHFQQFENSTHLCASHTLLTSYSQRVVIVVIIYLNVELELALVAIHKCLVLLHDQQYLVLRSKQ